MPHLSIVTPAYRCAACIPELHSRLSAVLPSITDDYEILFIDDGSPENDWEIIAGICARDPKVRGIKLSRNFGQHYAISAGLSRSLGDWVVVMDCDLQDRPEEIPALLEKAHEGYEIVVARRSLRQDEWLKRICSHGFYGILSYLTGAKQDPSVANFGVYSSKVVAAINSMPETIRYFPTMVRWVGYRSIAADVTHAARFEGKTSYNLRRLFNLGLDICLAYSDKPLRLVVKTGFTVSTLGFGFAVFTLIQALRGEIQVLGYASLIVSMWVLSGLLMTIVGVVGLYVGKIFDGVKKRPSFIIAQILNAGSYHEDV